MEDEMEERFALFIMGMNVVACKDFTSYNKVFKQFAELKNSQIETYKNGYGQSYYNYISLLFLISKINVALQQNSRPVLLPNGCFTIVF